MISIKRGELTLQDFEKIIFGNNKIKIDNSIFKIVEESYEFLKIFSKDKIIYGINTGFGPMARYKIKESSQIQLQYNLIRSHSGGMGEILKPQYAKASMLARLNTLSLGYSGVNVSVIETLTKMINNGVFSVIFENGGVGASGDLVQLAHIALGLIGEGKVIYNDEVRPTEKVFAEIGIQPIKIKLREGLAIMNGTSVMTGIGLINSIYAERAVNWSVMATILICELVNSFDDYFSEGLNYSKKHYGQQVVANAIKENLDESQFSRSRQHFLFDINSKEEVFDDKIQEYYSLRCVPQITGIIYETVKNCQKVLVEEVNSANDNPIVDIENKNVLHGGNFHGDYVSFEMDKLKIAITKLSMLAERQINFLMNPKLNDLLPPFINLGKLGFNFGMQGIQFTATSTTAENQTLSNPMYIHSIPNNNDNQDIVSMGTNAALMTKKVIDNTFNVLAIELMSIGQAIDYLNIKNGLSPKSKSVFDELRKISAKFVEDKTHYEDLKNIKEYLMENSPQLL